MSDTNDISFDPKKGKLPEEKLIAYLEGKLPAGEQHEVERWLADEGMECDAVEGLRALQPGQTKHSVDRLNHNLRKTLLARKRKRRTSRSDQQTWIAILIILLLVAIAYIIIRRAL
jgi:anti-sigma factor RsiW